MKRRFYAIESIRRTGRSGASEVVHSFDTKRGRDAWVANAPKRRKASLEDPHPPWRKRVPATAAEARLALAGSKTSEVRHSFVR